MTTATTSAPPRLVTFGMLWGAMLGIPLTLLAALIPSLILFSLNPDMGGESLAYLMFLGGTYCGILLLPAMVSSGVVGAVLGFYYRRRAQRVGTRRAMGVGVGIALLVFVVVILLLSLPFRESLFLDLPYPFALIWLTPTLFLLMGAYALLSSWLNRRLPN